MAEQIKGISIILEGETTGLEKALKDVNKKSRDLQGELKQVDRLLKLDPKNTELVAQKQKLLGEAIDNSKDKLKQLEDAQEQVNEQFKRGEISEAQYRAFQREVVKAKTELNGFEDQIQQTNKKVDTFGEKLEKAGNKAKDVGDNLKGTGENMTKYVTAPIIAAGAGLIAVGGQFDDAYDKIRIGTGATGEALEGLKEDFRAVAENVPDSFDSVSTAIAELNTRLGLSGEPLGELSAQILDLVRITEGDLAATIENTSQSFQAFNVPAEQYADSLDFVFKVSQATGIGIDRIQQNMVKFGPALKGMGFGFKDAAAIMGQFDKAGVDVESALAGLNKGIAKMAKDGVKDANKALTQLFTKVKNAPNDMAGTQAAIEAFGAKAGPALASAIREGKISYEELMTTLQGSGETISGVADETADWAEGFGELKNNALIATEPLASDLFDAVSGLIPILKDVIAMITELANWFGDLSPETQKTILVFIGLVAAIGPLLVAIGSIITTVGTVIGLFAVGGPLAGAITAIGGIFTFLTGPIGAVILAVTAVIAIWKLMGGDMEELKAKIQGFGAKTDEVFAKIKTSISEKIEGAKEAVRKAIEAIKGFFNFEWKLPKLKLPKIGVTGEFKLKPPQVPKFSLEWFKTGGIFNSPSIIGVGEAGPEAVIPISKLSGILADTLNQVGGTGGKLEHSGVIRVEGINNQGELTAVMPLVAREMRIDQSRYSNVASTRRMYR